MPSIAACAERFKIHPLEIEEIRKLQRDYRKEGILAVEASRRAVQDYVAKLEKEGKDMIDQIKSKYQVSEKPIPAPPAPGEATPSLAARGRLEEVITPKGMKVETRFRLVEANDLVTSIDTNFKENPNYLRELQPRDRDKVTSTNQIMRIYNKLDPEQLAESRGADTGAPVVGTDKMVESGNGRIVALKKLYADNHANAEKYRTWLIQNAERFGFKKEEITGIKNPVLIRENASAMTPEQRIAFARDANTPTTLVMSAGEKAKIDVDRLSPDVLSVFAPDESGNLLAASNREFIRSFLAKVPANEMGDFITAREGGLGAEAKLSAQGLARIKNAILAKAYGSENSDLITMMTEDAQSNIKNITNALLTAAPRQAVLMDAIARGERHPLSISKEISDAAKTISDLRNAGTNIQEYLLQGNLFGKNLVETELVKHFNDFKTTPRKIVDLLDTYAKMVDDIGNPKQMGFWGAQRPPEKLSILSAARELVEEKYAIPEQKGLFAPEGQPKRGLPPERPIPEEAPRRIPPGEEVHAKGIPGERPPEPSLNLKDIFKSGRKEITQEELSQLPDVVSGAKTPEQMRDYLETKGIAIRSQLQPEPVSAKQPWEMTRGEFVEAFQRAEMEGTVFGGGKASGKELIDLTDIARAKGLSGAIEAQRYVTIRQALSEGKNVPPEVLTDYPDLTKGQNVPMETPGVFMNPTPEQISQYVNNAPSNSKAIPAIKIDGMIVAGSRTTHGALLTEVEIQKYIDSGKRVELGFIDKKTGDYFEKKEMLGEKGFTGTHTPEDVGFFVNELRMNFKDAPNMEIVQTYADLPKHLLSQGDKGGAAVYDKSGGPRGTFYFVSDRIKNAQHAREGFFHEAVGHYGLPKMMGDSYLNLLQRVVRDFPGEVAAIAKKYGFDYKTDAGKWRAAEEKIAEVAQKGDHLGILKTMIATIRDWIRQVFPDLKLTDIDIRNLVRKASEQMKQGKIVPHIDPVQAKIETLRRQVGHQLGGKPKAGEMGRYSQDGPYFMLGDNIFNGSWLESIKNFREKHTLGIKGNDLHWSERLYMLPWHIGQKFANFRKLIDVQLNRDEAREQMNHEMIQKAFVGTKTEGHEFLSLPRNQAQEVFKVMIWSDDANKFFGKIEAGGRMVRDEVSLQAKAKELLGKDLNTDQVTAYYAWKKTMDQAWARVKKQHEMMLFAPHEDQSWFTDLKMGFEQFTKSKKRGQNFKDFILEGMEPTLFKAGGKYTEEQLKEIGRAADRLENPISRLKELRDDMGRWEYYVPRMREKGDYVIRGYDKDDKIMVSVRATDQISGARARDRFMKEYPGLRWEAKLEPQPIEEIYQKVNDIHLEQFIRKGIERAKKKEKITEEEANHITDALYEAVADDLKARGFASHFIMRGEGAAIKGYETQNGQKVFYDYMTGLSGFLTKQRAAFDFFKAMEGIDPSKQPELFKEGASYVSDMLRNADKLDKLSGKVRAAAFTWYLSGSVKAAMVQFTQNFVTGVPYLGRVTKNPLKKYTQAMKDVAVWKGRPDHLSKEEQQFLHEMHEKGIDTAQFLREIRGRMKSEVGGTLDKIGQVLATPFSAMEVFNRESASLAMFRVARSELKKPYREAFDMARDYVYNTHYLYGKSNLPPWARAGTPGSHLARTLYTFRSFNHNFLLSLTQSLKGPDGKIAIDVMGRTLAYLTLFGGATAIPFLDDLLDSMERLTGTPYRSNMRKVMQGIGGEFLAKFGMEGLPAILGADITGSLKIGIPTVSFSDVYGVYGGMYDKGKKAIDSFQRADIYRGIESLSPAFIEAPMKAYRMATGVATTPTGKVMFDEQGRPVELTPGEAISQTLGFRPERISVLGKEKRSLANVEKHYSDMRDDLYSKLRLAKPENRNEVFKQIREYNLEVQKYKGIVPPITQQMIRNALRQKPNQ